MCHGKIVCNSVSRVKSFLLSSHVITAGLQLLHSISQWFSTFSLKGAKSISTILWESRTKKIFTQVNSHVLLQNEVCYVKNVWGFIHRHSQWRLWGHFPPNFENI